MSSKRRDDATIALRVRPGFSCGSMLGESGESVKSTEPINEPCVDPENCRYISKKRGIASLKILPGLTNSGQNQYGSGLKFAIRSSTRLMSGPFSCLPHFV